ncbi:MAG: RAMP superfamily CRISPR-associated protein [Vulcanimicrobiota bacterium]
MATRTLKFALSSYWRVSSGRGGDALADTLVLRDANGLPVIPGRAVKGLLRDAMNLASLSGAVSSKSIVRWFGSQLPGYSVENEEHSQKLEEARYQTTEAELWFGSATLPSSWSSWAKDHPDSEVLSALFAFQSSTAIDKEGMAQEHSLRVAEVAVPMELRAEVRGPDEDLSWVQDLKNCLPLLRYLGSRRNRGLGRVDVSLEESK